MPPNIIFHKHRTLGITLWMLSREKRGSYIEASQYLIWTLKIFILMSVFLMGREATKIQMQDPTKSLNNKINSHLSMGDKISIGR